MSFSVPDEGCDIVGVQQRVREDFWRRKTIPNGSAMYLLLRAIETHGSSAMAVEDKEICSRWLSSNVMALLSHEKAFLAMCAVVDHTRFGHLLSCLVSATCCCQGSSRDTILRKRKPRLPNPGRPNHRWRQDHLRQLHFAIQSPKLSRWRGKLDTLFAPLGEVIKLSVISRGFLSFPFSALLSSGSGAALTLP